MHKLALKVQALLAGLKGGDATAKFGEFFFHFAAFELDKAGFGLFPAGFGCGLEKDFEKELAVAFGQRFGERGGVGLASGADSLDERVEDALGFEAFVAGGLDDAGGELLAEAFGF